MSNPIRLLPGIHNEPAGIAHVRTVLSDPQVFMPGWSYACGGMEDMHSPFLILTNTSGQNILILERRNDDGEWAPLMFACPPLDTTDPVAVLTHISSLGEWEQEDDPEGTLMVVDVYDVHEPMSSLLYLFRDVINPHALDN